MTTAVVAYTFEHEGTSYPLTPIVDGNEIWFDTREVCAGTGHKNPHQAIADNVHADDLRIAEGVDSLGRRAQVKQVNESGLYSLMLGGRTEACREFKRWATSEVLPSIRRTGAYGTPATEHHVVSLASIDQILQLGKGAQAEAFRCVRVGKLRLVSSELTTIATVPAGALQLAPVTALPSSTRQYLTPTAAAKILEVTPNGLGRLVTAAEWRCGGVWYPDVIDNGTVRLLDSAEYGQVYQLAADCLDQLRAKMVHGGEQS